MDGLPKRIERARELLMTARNAAMATVNEDGSPHNTPFRFMHRADLKYIYWGSHLESQHSRNILRTGQLFVVIYEAGEGGGLYIEADQGHPLEGLELDEGLKLLNEFLEREGKPALERDFYENDNQERLWSAKTIRFWVNLTQRDDKGAIIRDYRQEIEIADLQG